MLFWISYIRPIIYAASGLIALLLYWLASSQTDDPLLVTPYLIRVYGFLGIIFLYLALLASPLLAAFPSLPFRPVYVKARQALGVSAFFFGLLHSYFVVFKILGGIRAFFGLEALYLFPMMLGAIALFILAILTATSPGWMHVTLGTRWKPLHRLVYIAGILILLHATLIGSHFGTLTDYIPLTVLGATLFLFILEALRFTTFISRRHPGFSERGVRAFSITLFLFLFVGILATRSYFRVF
ncbi:MAG: hypothetical protein HY471_00240 [Candidatus Sungbacteria bacterium]|nr:hypothetical protein [Candidatus Sungbacteria bacterium]